MQAVKSDAKERPAQWWRPLGDGSGKVVCELCPRQCHIPEGQRGFCFVRANEGGRLVLTTYGRSSGFCIDPIEKKPLNHFFPGTSVLSLGTAGCNLGCKFCQNHDISKSRRMDALQSVATPEAVVEAAVAHDCKSIAFTYNDPTIWAEYAIDIARAARAAGVKTVAVTAGYISPEPRRAFYDCMDAANVDLKGFSETFYRKLTQTSLRPVLDTIAYIANETRCWLELTTLVIPGENDSDDELRAMCRWVVDHVGRDVPMHFTAFHPDYRMMNTPATPHATLVRARRIAMQAGVRYAYVGNVVDPRHEATYCPGCGMCVIERNRYQIGGYRLAGEKGDRCTRCGAAIPGAFDPAGRPGCWGSRRLPVLIDG